MQSLRFRAGAPSVAGHGLESARGDAGVFLVHRVPFFHGVPRGSARAGGKMGRRPDGVRGGAGVAESLAAYPTRAIRAGAGTAGELLLERLDDGLGERSLRSKL